MLTDTHAHLHFEQFRDDLDEVIARADEANVSRILTLGTDPASGKEAVSLSRRYDMVYAAVGIHPTDISNEPENDARVIKDLLAGEDKLVAVGEIGLDLYWKEISLDRQLPVFENMLKIADEKNLPVVIHNRDAHREMRQFFKDHGIKTLKGVMHSFSGTEEDAAFYMERGLFISFTGVITFKNYRETDVVRSVPPERLLLETDSPFLTPVPNRGKRNEPFNVRYIAQKLAEIHGMKAEKLAEITCRNAGSLFKWE